jgi:hypothetical protein
MIKGQDILLLLKLVTSTEQASPRQIDLARELGLSQAEVFKILKRCSKAGLLDPATRQVRRHALMEFLEHGAKYVFPAELGATTRGVPTAWAGPGLGKMIRSGDQEKPVWASADGSIRGPAIAPIYKTVPEVVAADKRLHTALACLDAIRIGRVRERNASVEILTKMVLGEQ